MTQETCPHGARVEYCCWDGKQVMSDDVHNMMMAMMNRFLLSLFSLLRSWNFGGTRYMGTILLGKLRSSSWDQSHNIISSVTGSNRVRMISIYLLKPCLLTVNHQYVKEVKMKTLPIIFVIGFLCLFNVTNSRSLNTQVTQFQIPLAEYVQDTINYCKWCYRTHTQLTKSIK